MTGPILKTAGAENLARSVRNLLNNPAAVRWLRGARGLSGASIEKFHLGICEPFYLNDKRRCVDALTAPIIGSDGAPKRRRLYFNIPNVTVNPKARDGWMRGAPIVYYSGAVNGKKRIFVCGDVQQLWRLDQETMNCPPLADLLFVASTGGVADEFGDPQFWAPFEKIYIGHPSDANGERVAAALRKRCFAEALRVVPPEDAGDWTDFFSDGAGIDRFIELLESAKPMSSGDLLPEADYTAKDASALPAISLGEFAVAPINCNGAYAGGFLYYPYRVEKREIERLRHRDGNVTETVVASYQTNVVRSDGTVLGIGYLPAPRGTPLGERVLALTDGTRVEQMPSPKLHATWQLKSIVEFIRHQQTGKPIDQPSLREILVRLEVHFRRSVWLPFEEDYTILALYTALSFVYNVFDAIPLVIVRGEKGSGKTELGLAVEAVAFNAKILGQSSAASAVRIINESRGLIVWDDLEALSAVGGDVFSDLHQMLKLSYKKKTSKKALTARNGEPTVFNFYGPKVINNTQGVDSVLGSRMLVIETRRIPSDLRTGWDSSGSEPEFTIGLRNHLHVWGMIYAGEINRRYRRLLRDGRGDRRDEILIPLRAIAGLSGDPRVVEQLERYDRRERNSKRETLEPVDLLREALVECVHEGFGNEVCLPHLQLKIALLARRSRDRLSTAAPFWMQSQWIGNALESLNLRMSDVKVRRARLYGEVTRIYKIREDFVRDVVSNEKSGEEKTTGRRSLKDPFDFCLGVVCEDCPFASICEETVPLLKKSKKKRFR